MQPPQYVNACITFHVARTLSETLKAFFSLTQKYITQNASRHTPLPLFCSFHSFMRLKKIEQLCVMFFMSATNTRKTTFTGDSTFHTPLFQGWFWCHNSQRTCGDPKKNASWLHYTKQNYSHLISHRRHHKFPLLFLSVVFSAISTQYAMHI